MTVAVDDPLIAGMTITRTLPLHESSQRLRGLCPECPRMYGVAVMGDVTRRRWWPLIEAVTTDRLSAMVHAATGETASRAVAARHIAGTLTHVVIGRVLPLLMLEGRAWDVGLENLWVHVDSDGGIDWVGVVDPTLRALPDDAFFTDPTAPARPTAADGIIALPGEAALTTWTAHRGHRALEPLFDALGEASTGAITPDAMWHIVGSAVVGAATLVPVMAGSGELTSMRRAQAVLDALAGFGLPVRGGRPGDRLAAIRAHRGFEYLACANNSDHRTAGSRWSVAGSPG